MENDAFREFPKWKYRKGEAVEVADAGAEKALGRGWKDAPAESSEADDE